VDALNVDALNVDALNVDALNVDALNVDALNVGALNITRAHWLLFIFVMPPLHRSQSMGKSSSSAREAGRACCFRCSETPTLRLRQQNAFYSDVGHNTPAPTLDEFGNNDF
jgi:hypothetical protein